MKPRSVPVVVLRATPDRHRRPSDGLVVEASILARLLRLRLLTLEATVVVVPAEVTAPPGAPPEVRRRAATGSAGALPPARPRVPPGAPPEVRRRAATGSAGALPPARPRVGDRRGLAEAVRTIDEGAAILAEALRTASRTGRRRGRGSSSLRFTRCPRRRSQPESRSSRPS